MVAAQLSASEVFLRDKLVAAAGDHFTDAQGRVLAPDRMTGAQRAAYQRWLSDPENDGVRVEMVRMFAALDAAGGRQGG